MATKIPIVKTEDKDFTNFQTQLGKSLQPILDNPINFGVALTEITLTSGSVNNVPTTLNRMLQGWFITRLRGQATVWDTGAASYNQTLDLNTSATVVVDLWVF